MTDQQMHQLQAALIVYAGIAGIITLVSIILTIIIWWRIFSKAGYSGAMGLWMFIPIANLIVLLILAFGEWPILRELHMLRQQVSSQPPQYPQSQYPFNQQGPQPSGPNYQAGPNYQSGPNYPRQ